MVDMNNAAKTIVLTVAVSGIMTLAGVGCHVLISHSASGPSNTLSSRDEHSDFHGIDVSHHQGEIDWVTVRKTEPNLVFVYVKCTEGKTWVDPRFQVNAEKAHRQGLLVGAYHYFRMTSSAHSQFRNFKKEMGKVAMDLIPMVDVERSDGRPRDELQDSLRVFLNLLEKEYGSKPMIYGTNRSYNEFCAPEFNNYPMYIGRYGINKPIVKGQSHYTIWQYSESGDIKGIPKSVDLCRLHPDCSLEDILLLRQ